MTYPSIIHYWGLPKEDLGVPETVLVLVKLDGFHHGCTCGLVVLGLCYGLSSKDVEP